MDKLFLIDGNSIINRAFYALPALTNKHGDYTNGVYGFFTMLFKFMQEENPTHIAVAFDLHAPTFRHKTYSAYKGTRKPMPEELRPQIPLLKEILSAMNIKVFEKEGYEADDILGTLARKGEEFGLYPVIISGDRDLLQIATEKTQIKIPKTKSFGTEVENYFAKDVFEKYGVTPAEFIEVKALMGDSSDNVPGVPSIGEKTAIKIIQQYKTVEKAIENAENIKPAKAAKNLKEFEEQALLSRFLVTINTNVPINADINELKIHDMFNQRAAEAFAYNEFNSLLSRFKTRPSQAEKLNIKIITEKADAEKFAASLPQKTAYKLIAENDTVCGCAFSTFSEEITVVLTDTEISLLGGTFTQDEFAEVFKPYFEGENQKITYDGKSDIVLLSKLGISLKNISFDTMLAAYLLSPTDSSYDFDKISAHYINKIFPSIEQITGKGKAHIPFYNLEKEKLSNLFADFVWVIEKTASVLNEELEKSGQKDLYYNVELPLIYVLADMELTGMRVDKQELEAFGRQLDEKLKQLVTEIYWLAGEEFNINSPKQLSVILFEKLGLKGGKKTKTGWSTSAEVLEKLRSQDEIVDKILTYRTYAKLKSTYCEGLLAALNPKTGKIHSTFNQTITATGRISSTEPNLQNIPIRLELGHRLRKAFVPSSEDYVFADGDYSQIELRVLAHLANDENLIAAFNHGEDIHKITASQAFGVPLDEVTPALRSNAKAVNFGIVYGISAFSLSQDLHISRKEAQSYIDSYFARYPKVKEFLDNSVEFAKANGFSKTMFNRIRPIPELSSSNFNLRSFGERVAMNAPVQGTSADIIKIAMIKIWQRIKKEGLKSRLVLQVHDELLIEAHVSEVQYINKMLKEEMENCVKLLVPLNVDVHNGKNWYEVK